MYRALTLSQHRSSPINNVRRRNASSFTLLLYSFYCEVFERRELPRYVAVTPVAGLFAWFMYRSAARFRFTSGHVVRFCSWLILVPNIESCQLTWRCLLRSVSASARCPRATCTVGSRSACRRLLLRYIFLGFALRITALTIRCNASSDYFSPLVALPTECVCIERCPTASSALLAVRRICAFLAFSQTLQRKRLSLTSFCSGYSTHLDSSL